MHFFTGVPGGPYPILLARSVDFDPYFAVLKARYPNPPDRILLLSMIGLVWDRAEPGGYMRTGSSAHVDARPSARRLSWVRCLFRGVRARHAGSLSNGENRLPGITRNKYAYIDYAQGDGTPYSLPLISSRV